MLCFSFVFYPLTLFSIRNKIFPYDNLILKFFSFFLQDIANCYRKKNHFDLGFTSITYVSTVSIEKKYVQQLNNWKCAYEMKIQNLFFSLLRSD